MSDLSVHVDFQVFNTYDPKTIIIGDYSNWGVAENQPAWLQITPPGSSVPLSISFTKHKIISLTSVNLGLSCVTQDCTDIDYEDLDDGIWEFCLQSSYEGLNKKRLYLKDDQLRQEIDKIRIRLGFDYNNEAKLILQNLQRVEELLAVSHAYIRDGRVSDCMKGYNEANRLVEKYSKCKNCY